MKKFLTFFVAACSALSASAQYKIKVSESSEKIASGKNNALVVTIYEAIPEEIDKEWRSLTKSYKAKVSSDNGQIFSDNAVIKDLSNNTIDIYARTEKAKDGETKFIAAFDLGGAFLTSSQHGEQFKVIRQIVHDFAVKTTREAIAVHRKEAEKQLDKLASEQKSLVKDAEDLKKDINDYKAKIEELNQKIKKAESDIVSNKSAQDKKKTEVDTQQKVVAEAVAKEKAVQ